MKLADAYDLVRPTIVAFCPKYIAIEDHEDEPLYFPILGTGFVVRETGLVATNAHVVELFEKQIRKKNPAPGEFAVCAIVSIASEDGYRQLQIEVVDVILLDEEPADPAAAIKEPADLAFVQLACRELPSAALAPDFRLREGEDIATAGYTMGTTGLVAPGYLQQVTPTLQRGVISALFPFPTPLPAGYAIDVMTQGGASGSPVFLPDSGKVVGILHGGPQEECEMDGVGPYLVPTSLSYVLPAATIFDALSAVQQQEEKLSALKSLSEMMKERTEINLGLEGLRLDQIHQNKPE